MKRLRSCQHTFSIQLQSILTEMTSFLRQMWAAVLYWKPPAITPFTLRPLCTCTGLFTPEKCRSEIFIVHILPMCWSARKRTFPAGSVPQIGLYRRLWAVRWLELQRKPPRIATHVINSAHQFFEICNIAPKLRRRILPAPSLRFFLFSRTGKTRGTLEGLM